MKSRSGSADRSSSATPISVQTQARRKKRWLRSPNDTFDLVISDIDMGGMSGLELVPHVHSLSPDTVVVMVSGNQDIEFAIKALRVGAFDYITKPIDLRHVEASVERALNHCNLLKEKRRYKEQIESLLQQRTAEVDWLAYYDTVTQLPNRALFEDRLTQAVAIAQANESVARRSVYFTRSV